MNRAKELRKALEKKIIIRFHRQTEPGSIGGYVLDIGPKFFLMATFGDGFRFDGFGCFRLSDVKSLEVPAAFSDLWAAVLKKRREKIPRKPKINVGGVEEILLSANKAFGLVTIHREKINPDTCHIGQLASVARGRVSLLEIGPDGEWEKEVTEYRLSEITLIEFGGNYEDGLALVGGTAPMPVSIPDKRVAMKT